MVTHVGNRRSAFRCLESAHDIVGGRHPLAALLLTGAFCTPGFCAEDVLSLSIEQLLEVKVTGASRYAQKSGDVAASPQVLAGDEIRASGARNLAEALGLLGGVHLHSDGVYTRLGSRGFLRTGDFNARILLLIDGRRVNELAYDGAYLGEEGPIDVSLIDRIEYIPGPGSSVYGSNALFGVINVISRKPADMPTATANVELSNRRYARIETGVALKFDHGGAGMLQLSRFQAPGRHRDASELGGAIVSGQSAGKDSEWANRMYLRYDNGGYSLSGTYVNREINVANGAYVSAPEFANQPNRDRLASLDIAYAKVLSPTLTLSSHLAASEYTFRSLGFFKMDSGRVEDNVQKADARWIDAESKLVANWRADSTLVAGLEFTHVPKLEFSVTVPSLKKVLVDQRNSYDRWGIYAQNDWAVTTPFTLSMGLRLDGQTGRESVLSPRVGAIWRPAEATAIKFQNGVAFRNPNAYELYYNVPQLGYRTNANLLKERISSSELTFEREFGSGVSLRVSGFRNKIDNLIDFAVDPNDGALVFSNVGAALIKGIQADVQIVQVNGWRARLGATVQSSTPAETANPAPIRNTPRQLAHVALFSPRSLSAMGMHGSLIWQYVGPQHGNGRDFGGYGVLNTTLIADNFLPHWTGTLGIKNLLGKGYEYPLGDEFLQTGERGAPREFWLAVRYQF